MQTKKPEVIVFAGPNESGKTTITKFAKIIEPYINADKIKESLHCDDLQAAATMCRVKKLFCDMKNVCSCFPNL